ncbi:MAG: hypothetical protein AAGF90_08850, partial [Pseudomonadota bacterium]
MRPKPRAGRAARPSAPQPFHPPRFSAVFHVSRKEAREAAMAENDDKGEQTRQAETLLRIAAS